MFHFARIGLFALFAGLLPISAKGGFAQENTPKMVRRHALTEDALRKQLNDPVPELGFNQAGAAHVYEQMEIAKKNSVQPPPDFGLTAYKQWAIRFNETQKWTAIPWKIGQDAQLSQDSAKRLQDLSVALRGYMRTAVPANGGTKPDPVKLRAALTNSSGREWNRPEAVPTLMQMLQPSDDPAIRALLIDMLANISGKAASVALAQRAVFDLSAENRDKAIQALSGRPREEYQKILLDTLRFPWAPAADHAAEAVAALRLMDLRPNLVQLLKEAAPNIPFETEVDGFKTPVVREMIRVNHLSNCCLCHPLSTTAGDLVRGRVPTPLQEMREPYYGQETGTFVRADITFLRQDFSLVLPVANPIKWSSQQRFDYFLRTRKATPQEVTDMRKLQRSKKPSEPYPQREAVLFALRELTGYDRGNRYEDWLPLVKSSNQQPESKK